MLWCLIQFMKGHCMKLSTRNLKATSFPPAPVVMEPPRYLPIRRSLPSEVAKALQDGTAIAVACEPSQRSGGEIKERRSLPGRNEDDYTVMSPVGTLSSSLHGGWGIQNSES